MSVNVTRIFSKHYFCDTYFNCIRFHKGIFDFDYFLIPRIDFHLLQMVICMFISHIIPSTITTYHLSILLYSRCKGLCYSNVKRIWFAIYISTGLDFIGFSYSTISILKIAILFANCIFFTKKYSISVIFASFKFSKKKKSIRTKYIRQSIA